MNVCILSLFYDGYDMIGYLCLYHVSSLVSQHGYTADRVDKAGSLTLLRQYVKSYKRSSPTDASAWTKLWYWMSFANVILYMFFMLIIFRVKMIRFIKFRSTLPAMDNNRTVNHGYCWVHLVPEMHQRGGKPRNALVRPGRVVKMVDVLTFLVSLKCHQRKGKIQTKVILLKHWNNSGQPNRN